MSITLPTAETFSLAELAACLTAEQLLCRVGRAGTKVHLGRTLSSRTACGHGYRRTIDSTRKAMIDRSMLCETCFPQRKTVEAVVDLTPTGVQTVEGMQRIAKATDAMHDAKSALANWTAKLCKGLAGGVSDSKQQAMALVALVGGHTDADADELADLLRAHRDAEAGFVHAVAGR